MYDSSVYSLTFLDLSEFRIALRPIQEQIPRSRRSSACLESAFFSAPWPNPSHIHAARAGDELHARVDTAGAPCKRSASTLYVHNGVNVHPYVWGVGYVCGRWSPARARVPDVGGLGVRGAPARCRVRRVVPRVGTDAVPGENTSNQCYVK